MKDAESFNQYRNLLFSIAYRMLGSATDAEDIVQEAYLRWRNASDEEVRSPKSYLSAIVTRLSIDFHKSARAKREVYVGPWLPEPLPTNAESDWTRRPEMAESVSMAFLLLLESLSPVERAVFLLHEVFDYSFAEIGNIVGKSEATCRQMAHRAKEHLRDHRPRYKASHDQQERIAHSFFQACEGGSMDHLLSLLTDNVVLTSDGGGKAQAARNPIKGPSNVARFILGLLQKSEVVTGMTVDVQQINGEPAIVTYQGGQPNSVWTFDFDGEQIRAINVVVNPDKLTKLASDSNAKLLLPDGPLSGGATAE